MAIETKRFTEERPEGRRTSREARRASASPALDTSRPAETRTDPAAIEAARARAMAKGRSSRGTHAKEERQLLDFTKDAVWKTERMIGGALQVVGGSIVVATSIGYQVSRPVLFTTARALDWIGQKMNSLADKLIDKRFPFLSFIFNPFMSFLDSCAKALGIDKKLAEHLKKNAQDRRKVAVKVFKDFKEAQKGQEKKEDDAKKKDKRRKKLEEVLGKDVAEVLEGELDDLDKAEAPAASAVTAAEAPKAE